MQLNNEIIYSFINCKYKAFLKCQSKNGESLEYQILADQLKQNQKSKFIKIVPSKKKILSTKIAFRTPFENEGIFLNPKFENKNISLKFDAVEIQKNKTIIPYFISPFEKITKLDKLSAALQAALLRSEFSFDIQSCIMVFGEELKHYKFKLSPFSNKIKKIYQELNEMISNSSAPNFINNSHCQICEFKNACYQKLKERDDLSLLAGMKEKEVRLKNNKGIFSVKQLSYTFRNRKSPYRKRLFLPELKALSIREDKTYIQEIPELKACSSEVFIDFEGIPDRNSIYLIGVIVKRVDGERVYSLWADTKKDEPRIFEELIHILEPLDDVVIYHYGNYEKKAIQRISKCLSEELQNDLKKIIDRSINLLTFFTTSIYPPTYSNGLKEIARFLKFQWTDREASGLQSIIWRYSWEITANKEFKKKLIRYNLEDCKALTVLSNWLKTIKSEENRNHFVSQIKPENIFKWGVTNYAVKEFEEINSRAYFDYQREHIFLRNTKRKIIKPKVVRKVGIYNKPDKKISLFPIRCPYCKSKEVVRLRTHEKLYVNMIFMRQGIKKNAILYTGGPAFCGKCSSKIATPNMHLIPMYGNNLMIWVVNQKIQYKQSSEQIANLLRDSLKIEVSLTQLTRFKEQIAKRYEATYREIISDIVKSELIHIDETIARIIGFDGYVWVFANMNNVFYEFRETRETNFLSELLKDFGGVLISDFYAGYDSLPCRQQKCLIHLIRDLNEDYLKNQLDVELKMIVLEFGKLLRLIIATIDRYGLKKFHLCKHENDVDRFYQKIISQKFESEFALSYQRRLLKYREKMFQFLQEDNIPWNNNNAEHSIKPFAKWRKKISKNLTKTNIENHLILLSILQTCKYRGVNFFEFLKSGETAIPLGYRRSR